MNQDNFPCEWDVWNDVDEADRKWRAEHAINKRRPEGHEKHEEAVRAKEGEGSVLRLDQQEETRKQEVAPVRKPNPAMFNDTVTIPKRKPGRPKGSGKKKNVDDIIAKIEGKSS